MLEQCVERFGKDIGKVCSTLSPACILLRLALFGFIVNSTSLDPSISVFTCSIWPTQSANVRRDFRASVLDSRNLSPHLQAINIGTTSVMLREEASQALDNEKVKADQGKPRDTRAMALPKRNGEKRGKKIKDMFCSLM